MGCTVGICMLLLQYYSPEVMEPNQHFFLMFFCESAEGQLTHLNNCSRCYGDNKGKIILTEFCKLWKHHAAYLRDMHNWNDDCTLSKHTNNTKFQIGQTVMVRNDMHWAFEPKYITDYRILKILHESTLLLVTPNGKECKMNINDVKPCAIVELVEIAWNTIPQLYKT